MYTDKILTGLITGLLAIIVVFSVKMSTQIAAIDKSMASIAESLSNGFSFISRPENPGKWGFESEALSINGREVESLGTFSSEERAKKTTKRPNREYGKCTGVMVPLYYKEEKKGK